MISYDWDVKWSPTGWLMVAGAALTSTSSCSTAARHLGLQSLQDLRCCALTPHLGKT